LRSALITSALALVLAGAFCAPAAAKPTLKGDLEGILILAPDGSGFARFEGHGNLTRMGRVAVYAEFLLDGAAAPGSFTGAGIAAITAANGDVLTASVVWLESGDLEFRWPGEVTFSDGTTVRSSGRFVELPFAGLRGFVLVSGESAKIRMTGEIIDPDPLD
jgi:hypothetical protein